MKDISRKVQKQYFKTEKEYRGYDDRTVDKAFVNIIDGYAGDILSEYVVSGSHVYDLLNDLKIGGSDAHQEFLNHYHMGVEAAAKASAKEHGHS